MAKLVRPLGAYASMFPSKKCELQVCVRTPSRASLLCMAGAASTSLHSKICRNVALSDKALPLKHTGLVGSTQMQVLPWRMQTTL